MSDFLPLEKEAAIVVRRKIEMYDCEKRKIVLKEETDKCVAGEIMHDSV